VGVLGLPLVSTCRAFRPACCLCCHQPRASSEVLDRLPLPLQAAPAVRDPRAPPGLSDRCGYRDYPVPLDSLASRLLSSISCSRIRFFRVSRAAALRAFGSSFLTRLGSSAAFSIRTRPLCRLGRLGRLSLGTLRLGHRRRFWGWLDRHLGNWWLRCVCRDDYLLFDHRLSGPGLRFVRRLWSKIQFRCFCILRGLFSRRPSRLFNGLGRLGAGSRRFWFVRSGTSALGAS